MTGRTEWDAGWAETGWEFAPEWTQGSLAATNRRDSRVISRVADFWGAFYLRPDGRFAGFSINLRLSGRSGRSGLRHRTDQADQAAGPEPMLLWEAIDLSHLSDRDFSGRCMLSNGRNEIYTDAVGKLVTVASPSSGQPYLKVMMSTEVRGLQLNWLQLGWPPKRYFFKRLQLTFHTELRQRRRGRMAA